MGTLNFGICCMRIGLYLPLTKRRGKKKNRDSVSLQYFHLKVKQSRASIM